MPNDLNPQIYYLRHHPEIVHNLSLACIDVLLKNLGQWMTSHEIYDELPDEIQTSLNEIMRDGEGGFSEPSSFVGACCAYASRRIGAIQHEERVSETAGDGIKVNSFCI